MIITGTTALDEDDPHNFLAALFKKEFTVRKQYRSPLHSSYTRYMKFHPGYRDDDVMSHGSPWFQRHVLGKEGKYNTTHHTTPPPPHHNTTLINNAYPLGHTTHTRLATQHIPCRTTYSYVFSQYRPPLLTTHPTNTSSLSLFSIGRYVLGIVPETGDKHSSPPHEKNTLTRHHKRGNKSKQHMSMGASEEGGSPTTPPPDDMPYGVSPGGYYNTMGDPDGEGSVESGASGEGDDFDHHSYNSQSQGDNSSLARYMTHLSLSYYIYTL